jgi:hypothetical protein
MLPPSSHERTNPRSSPASDGVASAVRALARKKASLIVGAACAAFAEHASTNARATACGFVTDAYSRSRNVGEVVGAAIELAAGRGIAGKCSGKARTGPCWTYSPSWRRSPQQ